MNVDTDSVEALTAGKLTEAFAAVLRQGIELGRAAERRDLGMPPRPQRPRLRLVPPGGDQ